MSLNRPEAEQESCQISPAEHTGPFLGGQPYSPTKAVVRIEGFRERPLRHTGLLPITSQWQKHSENSPKVCRIWDKAKWWASRELPEVKKARNKAGEKRPLQQTRKQCGLQSTGGSPTAQKSGVVAEKALITLWKHVSLSEINLKLQQKLCIHFLLPHKTLSPFSSFKGHTYLWIFVGQEWEVPISSVLCSGSY